MSIQVGQKAPDFVLYDTDKNKVSLSDQKGKNVVLLFFPAAFSSVCTAEVCFMRDNMSSFNHSGAQVFGISVDTVFTLKKFKESENLNFSLLSDFNKETIQAYDVMYEVFPALEMRGVSKRAAVVIDKEGTVRYSEVCPTPGDQPDYKAIENVLGELK